MYQSNVVPAKPKISPVTVALQQLSGETLIGAFSPEGNNRSVLFNFLFGLIDSLIRFIYNSNAVGYSSALGR